jgi:ferrous iron transport protein A
MITLKEVKPGMTVRVTRIGGEGAIKRRIMDMGITRGASVFVRKVAPLGDPIEVTVRGYELSLRKADAENINIETDGIGVKAEKIGIKADAETVGIE